MAAKVCPRCGFYNNPLRKECSLCSTPLDGEVAKGVPFKMSFYAVRASNNRLSVILVLVLLVLLGVLGYFAGEYFSIGYFGVAIALLFALISSLAAYYGGKDMVLAISGAKRVTKESEPQLVNIVEEMSIASGNPVPEVYVIESGALNAFATGRDPKHAAVAVTRGLMEKLNREELTGVVAHEMSHVSHLDIKFAMMVGVLVGTIVMISDIVTRWMFFSRRRDRQKGNGGIIILAIALVLAIIAPILAKLIQMAVSRKRELMADARAAEYTRNPEALASALEKIAGSSIKLESATRATQHMFISNPFKNFSKSSSALFSTHPPIETRIKILRSM